MRPKNQDKRGITTVGTENLKIIYSPGFIFEEEYVILYLCMFNEGLHIMIITTTALVRMHIYHFY